MCKMTKNGFAKKKRLTRKRFCDIITLGGVNAFFMNHKKIESRQAKEDYYAKEFARSDQNIAAHKCGCILCAFLKKRLKNYIDFGGTL